MSEKPKTKKIEKSFADEHEFKLELKPVNYFFIVCMFVGAVCFLATLIPW